MNEANNKFWIMIKKNNSTTRIMNSDNFNANELAGIIENFKGSGLLLTCGKLPKKAQDLILHYWNS